MGWPVILDRAMHARRRFDPHLEEDVAELNHYIQHNHWRNGCPFVLEGTYLDIPSQCLLKWAKHSLRDATT